MEKYHILLSCQDFRFIPGYVLAGSYVEACQNLGLNFVIDEEDIVLNPRLEFGGRSIAVTLIKEFKEISSANHLRELVEEYERDIA